MSSEIKEIKETVVEWVDVDDKVMVSTWQRKYIKKLKELSDAYPGEVKIVAENNDNTICVSLPKKFVHVSFGEPRARREISEEDKEVLRNNLKKAREARAGKT